jgi:sugar lactone lactonase YvrE
MSVPGVPKQGRIVEAQAYAGGDHQRWSLVNNKLKFKPLSDLRQELYLAIASNGDVSLDTAANATMIVAEDPAIAQHSVLFKNNTTTVAVVLLEQNNTQIREIAPNGSVSLDLFAGVRYKIVDKTANKPLYPAVVVADSPQTVNINAEDLVEIKFENQADVEAEILSVADSRVVVTVVARGTANVNMNRGISYIIRNKANQYPLKPDIELADVPKSIVITAVQYPTLSLLAGGTTLPVGSNVSISDGIGPAATFRPIRGMAFYKDRRTLYITDQASHVIRRVDQYGETSTFVGTPNVAGDKDSSFVYAQLHSPSCITLNQATGDLYVVESHRIRKVSKYGDVSVLAGSDRYGFAHGKGAEAKFYSPQGIVYCPHSDQLYVSDTGNKILRRVLTDGLTFYLMGEGTKEAHAGIVAANFSPDNTRFSRPTAMAVAPNGDLYIADYGSSTIYMFPSINSRRRDLTTLATGIVGIMDLTFDDKRNLLYAIGSRNVYTISTTGEVTTIKWLTKDKPGLHSDINSPLSIDIDSDLNVVYIGTDNAIYSLTSMLYVCSGCLSTLVVICLFMRVVLCIACCMFFVLFVCST